MNKSACKQTGQKPINNLLNKLKYWICALNALNSTHAIYVDNIKSNNSAKKKKTYSTALNIFLF